MKLIIATLLLMVLALGGVAHKAQGKIQEDSFSSDLEQFPDRELGFGKRVCRRRSCRKNKHCKGLFCRLASNTECIDNVCQQPMLTPPQAFVINGPSPDLMVVACGPETIEIQGERAVEVVPGTFLVSAISDISSAAGCDPLFRKIESVTDGDTEDSKVLTTTFATFGEIFGPDIFDEELLDEPLEPVAGCSHSGVGSGRVLTEVKDLQAHRNLQAFPSTCDAWRSKNGDGRCTYTDCFVGSDGDADNCFNCNTTCDNGCGAEGSIFQTDGDFGSFDFGEACCIHDYCYSSTFDRRICDVMFSEDMRMQCAAIPSGEFFVIAELPSVLGCRALAFGFYVAVRLKGGGAHEDAQEKQKNYEEQEDVCVAQCPSTQESGGQGTTRLIIDLLQSAGTFPVSYEMFSIPDQLYITYEGTRIFDTGGLVSGSTSTQVNYSGTSTRIEVTIFAPNAGTAWDVFVGCPI